MLYGTVWKNHTLRMPLQALSWKWRELRYKPRWSRADWGRGKVTERPKIFPCYCNWLLAKNGKYFELKSEWNVKPCCPVEVHRRFRESYCLHLHGRRENEARNRAVRGALLATYFLHVSYLAYCSLKPAIVKCVRNSCSLHIRFQMCFLNFCTSLAYSPCYLFISNMLWQRLTEKIFPWYSCFVNYSACW
jgi:hypothetical protein